MPVCLFTLVSGVQGVGVGYGGGVAAPDIHLACISEVGIQSKI